jgi:hypothetical protein
MKIPDDILELFDIESNGITHGIVKLELFLRDGKPRFTIGREHSHYPFENNLIQSKQKYLDKPMEKYNE